MEETTIRRVSPETMGKPEVSLSNLLACPFCGGEAEIEPWHGGAPTKHMIACSDSLCQVGPMVTGETLEEAIEHWNTRAN